MKTQSEKKIGKTQPHVSSSGPGTGLRMAAQTGSIILAVHLISLASSTLFT